MSSPLIRQIVPRMIDDALRLSVDLLFPKETNGKLYESRFPVENYSNSENLYEYLGNINDR